MVEVASRRGDESRLVRLRSGRVEAIDLGNAKQKHLHDVAVIGGEPRILATTYVGDENTAKADPWGYLYVQDVDGSSRRRVTVAYRPEFGIGRASYGGGVIATSATADLTEVFEYFRPDGTQVKDRPNPTEDLPYAEPPYMSDAVLSSDGHFLAYLEGPDTSSESPEEQIGSWVAVVLDQNTGRERLRVEVEDKGRCVSWLDFDGRWLVISRSLKARADATIPLCGVPGAEPLPVVVLDMRAEPLELVELTDIVGVATLDD
ncbi:MAG: hypothetical protein M3N24_07985 [Actinomycetota bacterium]|nr:hypothetical protein [Actinomycetota bacterium]